MAADLCGSAVGSLAHWLAGLHTEGPSHCHHINHILSGKRLCKKTQPAFVANRKPANVTSVAQLRLKVQSWHFNCTVCFV